MFIGFSPSEAWKVHTMKWLIKEHTNRLNSINKTQQDCHSVNVGLGPNIDHRERAQRNTCLLL